MRYAPFLVIAVVCLAGCGKPAQMGSDPEVFRAVDALYTAVTSRRPPLLEQCAKNVEKLRAAEKIPEPAYEELSGIIERARGGDWKPAADRLHWFMRGQKRT
jgi:hypothetical protein